MSFDKISSSEKKFSELSKASRFLSAFEVVESLSDLKRVLWNDF